MTISVDRKHSLAGRETLAWFFANRKWIRIAARDGSHQAMVESAWAKRPLPGSEANIRFLLLAPKRSYKRAHDRNKIKRWLRAAITEVERFVQLEEKLHSSGEQLLVMFRISKPIADVKWPIILDDMQTIAEQLRKRI